MNDKLQAANNIIQEEEENKIIIQENLKKAFMRGVCALNLEAMSILKNTDGSNDVNSLLFQTTQNVQQEEIPKPRTQPRMEMMNTFYQPSQSM